MNDGSSQQDATDETTGATRAKVFAPLDIAPLIFFRIFFGGAMVYHVTSMAWDQWIHFFYIAPVTHFTYPGFTWVRPWPGDAMYVHFTVMGVAAFFVMIGFLYRLNAAIFFLCITHVFLIEKALYQNHYYLICLLSGIMVFVPAHGSASVDRLLKPSLRQVTAPAVWLWLLRAQLAIPYLYGGIAKLNADWLHGMPIRLWLERRADLPWIGPWLNTELSVSVFVWGGPLFDLLIVPALLWKPTRGVAYLLSVVFHLINALLWDIGIFPWFMIGATLLFFSPGSFRRILSLRAVKVLEQPRNRLPWNRRQRLLAGCLAIYMAWQLLWPFRHFLYPGNVSWTEEGHHFAWHMMLRDKGVGIRFFLFDRSTGKRGLLKVSTFLNERQLSRMGKDPDMILEFVHFVRDHYREHGRDELAIRVLALASLNGRRPQLLIDPHIDYTAVERTWGKQYWVIPLHEPIQTDGWKLPLDQWENELAELIPDDVKLVNPVQRLQRSEKGAQIPD